jgi:hypothetical protein
MLHQGDRLRRGGGAEQGRYPFLETIAAAFDHRGARPQSCARSSGGAARARLVPVKTAPDPSAVVIGVTLPDAGAKRVSDDGETGYAERSQDWRAGCCASTARPVAQSGK